MAKQTRPNVIFNLLLVTLIIAIQLLQVNCWSNGSSPSRFTMPRRRHSPTTNQPINSEETVPRVQITSKNMLRETKYFYGNKLNDDSTLRANRLKLSQSVLDNNDSFPSFPVANGILSPQTVRRLDELTRLHRYNSPALHLFLKSYYTKGPMSCLPMLSDPDVLPHLTMAMREATA